LTVAWDINGPVWAAEGNIRSTGATLAWLAGLSGSTVTKLAEQAAHVADPGVDLVPAFAGLGAPWWSRRSGGTVSGITFDTGVAELARAALDSTAFQVADVIAAARRSGLDIRLVLADGGASSNDALMQFQADVLDIEVARSTSAESSAIGAAHLAGITAGLWTDADLRDRHHQRTVFTPQMPDRIRRDRLDRWSRAIDQTLHAG
jgi:glycerol kinase